MDLDACDVRLLSGLKEAGEGRAVLRGSLERARVVVVKAGTGVVSREDGVPSLHRISLLVEQIADLVRQGKQVLFVTSGATGIGRHLLRQQALLKSSIGEALQGHRSSLSHELVASRNLYSAPAAAAGQLGLMTLYSTLFSTQSIPVAQMLTTAADFESPECRSNIRATLLRMLELGIVPILNENDAVSANPTRIHTGKGSFEDNDMLAALIAREMDASVVVFVSDVNGVYTASPELPGSQRISIFSRSSMPELSNTGRGRGGMQAKLFAALSALDGSPYTRADCKAPNAALIVSGLSNSITEAFKGADVGTLFLSKDAEAAYEKLSGGSRNADSEEGIAVAARDAGRDLSTADASVRTAILETLANLLEQNTDAILAENEKDCALGAAALSAPLLARLRLTARKIQSLVEGTRVLAREPDPLGKSRLERPLSDTLKLKQISVPIGVLLIVFESRPDCLPQIASLAIRSGNALLLKGGKEALHSNSILHRIVGQALAAHGMSPACVGLLPSRDSVSALLTSPLVDLIIPRGSNELVTSIQSRTHIPVLGHAAGICHVYIDCNASLNVAEKVCLDAKTSYPSACNSVETILVHQDVAESVGLPLAARLRKAGVEICFGPAAERLGFGEDRADFSKEYGALQVNFEVIPSLEDAVSHIHTYGSGHTESIVTSDEAAAQRFLASVDSACVFWNASTRFADGKRFKLGAEVGISTGKIHARGPVGVEGLLTTKWILTGNLLGDAVGEYESEDATKKYS